MSKIAEPKTVKLPCLADYIDQIESQDVTLPWLQKPENRKVLMFYHSKNHIFGCQFSNLYRCNVEINTKYPIYSPKNDTETLFLHQTNKNNTIITLKSTENVFQAAKALHGL